MVKIKSIQKLPEKNQYGLWTYTITLEDGKRCYYRTKEDNQTTFTEGMETDAIVEEKQKADGTGVYYTIKPNRPAFGGGKGGYTRNDKAIAASVALQEATKFVCSRTELKTDAIFPLADKMYKWLEDKGAIPNG
jgi:hypothetical protein